jgi:uncharacterized membrane protein YphA (DoxX/SURF4 family)
VSPTTSVRLAGDTGTDAAATDVTATGGSAASPSADACTAVCPTVVALTTPVELTGATDAFLLDHVIVRLGIATPFASRTSAASCVLWPNVSDMLPGVIAIEVGTGALTVSGALPTFASQMALIVTDPFAIAVTSPFESTVASAGFELCQATRRPLKTFPCASLMVAVACVVCPTESVLLASDTPTDAAGTSRTLMDAVAFLLFDWAVMMARPLATPVTSPASDTVAMDILEDVHFMLMLDKVRPLASNAVAMSWTLSRGTIDAFCGVTLIGGHAAAKDVDRRGTR